MFEPTTVFGAELQTLPPSAATGPEVSRPKRRSHGRLQRLCELYGACDGMRTLFDMLDKIADASATVIVLGESGSGKELVANAIHQLSERRQRPFIAVNCGALPETLIESELFGHERGSFTGAQRTHHGCFERANGGTLFLDEVTEMPIDMQVRLLRVLETGRFCRVGGDTEITADVRVIAASNRDVGQAVAEGRLREDLMYRLCVIPVIVPNLRERDDDALLLAEMFLAELNDEHGTNKRFTEIARQRIASHSWPGNVRELKNVVHRAFVLSDDEVDVDVCGGSFGDPALVAPVTTMSAATATVTPIAPASAASLASVYGTSPSRDREVTIKVGTSLEEAERALIMATLNAVAGS